METWGHTLMGFEWMNFLAYHLPMGVTLTIVSGSHSELYFNVNNELLYLS